MSEKETSLPSVATTQYDTHQQTSSGENAVREPLAIIGIGCHFPGGATSPQAFWDLLCAGVDATRDIPADRWDARKFYDPDSKKSGKMNAYHGGYLERLDLFDAQFFGISPREAVWLDPQQRLLLQVTWEALENAGLVAERLAGSNTGVFIGGFTLDYQLMQNFGVYSRYELQTHSATGMMMTMLANRISYVFGFHGPSLAVDTACSGSLVAVHLACQSIWDGECSLAIAGGANAMIAPTMTIAESKGGFLSPDGRCKTFDASANGYARGEGAGVVIIKSLSRAQADGDPIYAVIRGTAVTQDGHTNGITVPNGAAQQRAMRLAYQRAGVLPEQIQYVEAHGTGTPVGDPIEARAIGGVVSSGRAEGEYCIVGSVKTNIGHLEAAAGVAGLIKTALALKHRQIPPHLNFHHSNPDIPFEELHLRVPTRLEAWPESDGLALAGVNSFGFGGTNAHVVLQEAPRVPECVNATDEGQQPYLLPLSARSAEALQEMAGAYRAFLAVEAPQLNDIAFSTALRRSHHDHRLALIARSKAEAVTQLEAFLADPQRSGVRSGHVSPNERPKIVFVCSGMGPQWWAMGRELLESEPVFRAAIERCDAEFQRYANWSLLDALRASEEESRMEETEVAQPTNFAIQVALAELWRSWGIEPDAIIGHSAGEVAAHYLAGALSFEDAVCVIYHRSRLQQRATGQGKMLAVGMTIETLKQAVDNAGEGVSIAAINSPSAITLVGEAEILENMARQLETFQVFHRFLAVKVPYHSHYMDPPRDELLASLADLHPQSAKLPLYSTVTGTRIDGSGVDANYWWQNVRATVLFGAAISQMIQDGYSVFVELGPHPVLASSMNELLAQQGQTGCVLPSLKRKAQDHEVMLNSLGTLYTLGTPVAWDTLYGNAGRFVHLPSYPWQLKHYWTESVESREDRLFAPVHPLLGQRMSAAYPTWEREISSHLLPYLIDHRIQENVLLPGAAYAEMALAAARQVFGEGVYTLEELTFCKALFLSDASDPRLQTVVNPQKATVEIYSYTPSAPSVDARWALHATARLSQRQPGAGAACFDLNDLEGRWHDELSKECFYQQTLEKGFQYGPAFQAVEHVYMGSGEALGYLQLPLTVEAELGDYLFHPALLDAAFQVLLATTRTGEPGALEAVPYLPVSIDRVRMVRCPVASMRAYARLVQADKQYVVGDIQIVDPEGSVLLAIEGFRAQSLEASMSLTAERIDKLLYELAWQPKERSADEETNEGERTVQTGGWLIFADERGTGETLSRYLEERGEQYVIVRHMETAELHAQDGHYALDAGNPEHFRQLFAALAATGRSTYAHLVYLWGCDSTCADEPSLAALEQDQTLVCLAVVSMIQALSQSGWSHLPLVWLVTRGTQAVGTPGLLALGQAPLWGLGRVIGHQEFTSIWGGLIDLDPQTEPKQVAQLFEEISYSDHEDQVAFRGGQRYVVRLGASTRLTPPLASTFRPDGSYLITGGLGKLGLLTARWMVTQGARRLILMGRTEVPPRSSWRHLAAGHPQKQVVQAIQELEQLGASIHLATVDVADEGPLARFLAAYEQEGWPVIRGVMHTAGVVQDELLLRMKKETFQRVLRPKLRGGWLLHELLKDYPLDFFILFSSTGSVIASLGQSNYAAGNAFLDALASHRQALGLPALSIGWGPWSIGMVEQLKLEEFYIRRGIDLITPEIGMQVLARIMEQRPAHLTVISANWAVARESSPLGTLPPMFELLGEQTEEVGEKQAGGEGEFLHQLRAAAASERQELVVAHLQELVARVLQLEAVQFGSQEALTSLGMDSMMAIEVKHRIAASVKVDVSVLELLQGCTIGQLAARILSTLQLEEVQPLTETAAIEEIERLVELTDSEELERLLAELEQLSENGAMA